MQSEKVYIISLGCSKNLVDSELMMNYLVEGGYTLTDVIEDAEIIVVNTCAFIESARSEAIDTILEAAEYKQTGNCKTLVVAGCLPQRYIAELQSELPEADVLMGVYDVPRICELIDTSRIKRASSVCGTPDYMEKAKRKIRSTPKHYAYLKIADGCDNRCSYCAIPSIRGPYKSRSLESVLAEAEYMAETGVKEVMLIAQDTTNYGMDLYGKRMLPELCRRIAEIDGIEWIRLLYLYPNGISDELLEVMKTEPKMCKYIDLPLQHINDTMMRSMNRHTDSEEVYGVLKKLRDIGGFTLRTSLIVGYPGETEEMFNELCRFVRESGFDRMGAFTYSQEEGTVAASLPDQIDEEVKNERLDILMSIQADVSEKLNSARVGTTCKVIIDEYDEDIMMYIGRSQAEAPDVDGVVYVTSEKNIEIGSIAEVRITDFAEYDLLGECV